MDEAECKHFMEIAYSMADYEAFGMDMVDNHIEGYRELPDEDRELLGIDLDAFADRAHKAVPPPAAWSLGCFVAF